MSGLEPEPAERPAVAGRDRHDVLDVAVGVGRGAAAQQPRDRGRRDPVPDVADAVDVHRRTVPSRRSTAGNRAERARPHGATRGPWA
jgi:hypothetical protein